MKFNIKTILPILVALSCVNLQAANYTNTNPIPGANRLQQPVAHPIAPLPNQLNQPIAPLPISPTTVKRILKGLHFSLGLLTVYGKKDFYPNVIIIGLTFFIHHGLLPIIFRDEPLISKKQSIGYVALGMATSNIITPSMIGAFYKYFKS